MADRPCSRFVPNHSHREFESVSLPSVAIIGCPHSRFPFASPTLEILAQATLSWYFRFMHIPTRNDANLLHPGPQPDDFRDIRELNLLFLILLQSRARRGAHCFGLAPPVRRRIRDASDGALKGVSTFPRTVFALNLDCIRTGPEIPEERDDQMRRARHALALTAVLTAWNMARQRCFHAKIFLGLSEDESRRLKALPMMKLHELAEHPALLRCAFADAVGLWTRLVQHGERGLPTSLRLLGLQPKLFTDAGEVRTSYSSRIA